MTDYADTRLHQWASSSADATGTATFFRITDSDDYRRAVRTLAQLGGQG